ncbi:MAG: tetratricopeptide repeat protein [Cytophagales bacterium]
MKKFVALALFFAVSLTYSASKVTGSEFDKKCRHRLERYFKGVTIEDATMDIENNMFLRENYTHRGFAYILAGDFKKALEDFNEVLKIDPKTAWLAILHRGYAYACDNNFYLAKVDFNKYAGNFPKDSTVFYYLGVIKFLEKDYKGAQAEFEKQLIINSKDIDCYLMRAECKMAQLYIREAVDDYSKAIEINPKSFVSYNGRGFARTKLQDYKNAMKDLDKAMELMKEANNEPMKRLKYSNKQQDPKQINGFHEEYLDIAYAIYNNRGSAKMDAKNYKAAIEDFNEAIKLNKNNTVGYNNRAICKIYIDDLPGAYDDFSELIILKPDSPEIYFNRGVVRNDLNDVKGAIEDFTESLKRNPKNGQVYYQRALAKKKLGASVEACEDFNRALTYGFKEFPSSDMSGCK